MQQSKNLVLHHLLFQIQLTVDGSYSNIDVDRYSCFNVGLTGKSFNIMLAGTFTPVDRCPVCDKQLLKTCLLHGEDNIVFVFVVCV